MINDFVLLHFRARAPEDLSDIEVIFIIIITDHYHVWMFYRWQSLCDTHQSDVAYLTAYLHVRTAVRHTTGEDGEPLSLPVALRASQVEDSGWLFGCGWLSRQLRDVPVTKI